MQSDVEPNQAEVSGFMSESDAEYDDQEPHHKAEEDDNERMADNSSNNKNNTSKTPSDGAEVDGEPKKKYDSKDPMRPRRKKARRACFACQRAHLTCGMSVSLRNFSSRKQNVTVDLHSTTFYPEWHLVFQDIASLFHILTSNATR